MSESATERLTRLLALVPWLQANDGITIGEAARHFGVSVEQLSTDLWQIIVCGIPGYGPDQLIDIQFWDDDRIHVLNPVALEQPMHLTPEEVTALHLGLRVLAQVPGDHDQQALISAMVKLESAAEVPIPVDIEISERPDIVAMITEAIDTGASVEIDYAAGDDDRVETRTIQPRTSFTVDGRVYLQAWCSVAAAVRTFRTDRIHRARVVESDSAQPRPDITVDTPLRPEPENMATALVRIHPDALWVLDTEPVSVVSTNPSTSDATVEAEIGYASPQWLVRWVLGLGGGVTVLEPAELRQSVAEAARLRRGEG